MNFKKILFVGALAWLSASAFAQDKPQIQFYGFVRNYYTYDSRACQSGTAELYNYLPLDVNDNGQGQDLNAVPTAKWSSLTSRLGVDVKGYSYKDYSFSAKIEADFYSGLSGVTGTARPGTRWQPIFRTALPLKQQCLLGLSTVLHR